MKKKWKEDLKHVVCECGYNNQPWNAEYYGTCTRCGKIINQEAYFKRMMNKKLKLWRGKKW
jgi:hypothetical protein